MALLPQSDCSGWSRSLYQTPVFLVWSQSSNKLEVHKASDLVPKDAPSLKPGFYTDALKGGQKVDSASQLQQDFLVLEYLGNKKNGYYVDLAANHYQILSNTYYLEKMNGWSGLCFEPNPMYHSGMLSNRACLLITSPVSSYSNMKVKFNFGGTDNQTKTDGAFGGIVDPNADNKSVLEGNYMEMSTTSLMTVLHYVQAPPVIDYFSLDVEGSEFDVMKHFDFGAYKFLIVTLERPSRQLHHLMTRHQYWFVKQLSWFGETIYVHESIPNFHKIMSAAVANRTVDNWINTNQYVLHPKYVPRG